MCARFAFLSCFLFFYTIRIFISFCCSRFFARFSSAVCARKITQLVNCTNNMSALLQRSFKQGRECATNLRAGKRHKTRGSPLGMVRLAMVGSGLVWFARLWSGCLCSIITQVSLSFGAEWNESMCTKKLLRPLQIKHSPSSGLMLDQKY